MVSTVISGQFVEKRCCVINVKCVVLVLCLAMSIGVTMGHEDVGSACTLSNGRPGICRYPSNCSTFNLHSSSTVTCGFRAQASIVCCLERRASSEDRLANDPWRRGNAPHNAQLVHKEDEAEQLDEEYVDDYEQPTTRRTTTRRTTNRRRTTSRTTTRKPNSPPSWSFNENASRPLPKPTSRPPGVSTAKCTEYSRLVQKKVEALPLLPVSEPLTIQVEKCKFNGLELIVGGKNTSVGEYPHMAALGYLGEDGYEWNCGGTLISELFVITAAHCTISKRGPLQIVRLGELNLKSDFDGASPVNYRVKEIIRHPDYTYSQRYNDIALLRLTTRVVFNDNIRPACLYTGTGLNYKKATATGWGHIAFGDEASDNLLKVSIDIIDTKTCNQLYQSSSASSKLSKGIIHSMLCAGDLNGNKDTCQGDSGGPIQISSSKNQCIHYVIGITSFGRGCGVVNSPGIYTRVSAFIPWIEKTVWPSD